MGGHVLIHRALKLVREFHHVKQSALADRLQISKSYLSEIEAGKKDATLEILNLYASAFRVPASTFLILAERLDGPISRNQKNRAEKVLQLLEWVVKEEEHGAA